MSIDMFFDTVMDRPAERDVHYISPGGYELKFASGQTVQFDFCTSVGNIDENDPRIVHWHVYHFDEEYKESCTEESVASLLKQNGVAGFSVEEFYVHTGEYDDPDISCTAIRNWCIEIKDEGEKVTTYNFPDFALGDDYTPTSDDISVKRSTDSDNEDNGSDFIVTVYEAEMETKYGPSFATVYDDPEAPRYPTEESAIAALKDQVGFVDSTDENSLYPGHYFDDDELGAFFEYKGHRNISFPRSHSVAKKFLAAREYARNSN